MTTELIYLQSCSDRSMLKPDFSTGTLTGAAGINRYTPTTAGLSPALPHWCAHVLPVSRKILCSQVIFAIKMWGSFNLKMSSTAGKYSISAVCLWFKIYYLSIAFFFSQNNFSTIFIAVIPINQADLRSSMNKPPAAQSRKHCSFTYDIHTQLYSQVGFFCFFKSFMFGWVVTDICLWVVCLIETVASF